METLGLSLRAAQRIVERQTEGVLLPNIELVFDDPDLRGTTVADVLADSDRFSGATLANPLEGPDYGGCKAKVMRRSDGTLWIYSFAHGRTVYELRHDAASVEAALQQTDRADVTEAFAIAASSRTDRRRGPASPGSRQRPIGCRQARHRRHGRSGARAADRTTRPGAGATPRR